MSKSTITVLFVGSLIAIVAGLVVFALSAIVALANGSLVMTGSEVTGVEMTPLAWSMVALALLGILAMAGGAFGQFVAWIGAVINTAYLEDKTWFVVLLVLGLLSFGFIAMLVYVIAGPDGTKVRQLRQGAPA
ncbi:MAG TPA: hypothetical protein VIF84_07785 [Candidatus Limnocylindrales bacterium]|jgi:hypothetical protein